MPPLMGVIVRHHVAAVAHLVEEVRHLGVVPPRVAVDEPHASRSYASWSALNNPLSGQVQATIAGWRERLSNDAPKRAVRIEANGGYSSALLPPRQGGESLVWPPRRCHSTAVSVFMDRAWMFSFSSLARIPFTN